MSEENEVLTIEQLQNMAAEQDQLSGYDEGSHPAMQGPQETQARLEKQKSATDTADSESVKADSAEATKPEDKAPDKGSDKESETDLAKGPPEVDTSSLKAGESDDKMEKSEKRLNESWKKVNSQKEENRKIREELEDLREQLNEKAKPEKYLDEDGNSADDYEAAAKNFEAEGEMALAQQARALASEVEEKAQGDATNRVERTFKREWADNFDRAAESYPELSESESPFRNAVDKMIRDRPVLATYSAGILDAAALVAMQIKAGQSTALQNQITSLKEENGDLRNKLSIGGSDPVGSTAGPASFDDMSASEQFAELRRRAAEVDASHGGY